MHATAEMYRPTTCGEKAFTGAEDDDVGEKDTSAVEAVGKTGDAVDEEEGGRRHALDGDGGVVAGSSGEHGIATALGDGLASVTCG